MLLSLYSLIIFTFIFLWSYKTPFYNDDLFFVDHNAGVKSILVSGMDDYLVRHLPESFYLKILFFSICTGIAFVLLCLILLNLTNAIKNSSMYLERVIITTISIMLFVPGFASVFIWRAGVGNYLMTAVVEMLFLLIVYKKPRRDNKLISTAAIFIGFIAGWGEKTRILLAVLC